MPGITLSPNSGYSTRACSQDVFGPMDSRSSDDGRLGEALGAPAQLVRGVYVRPVAGHAWSLATNVSRELRSTRFATQQYVHELLATLLLVLGNGLPLLPELLKSFFIDSLPCRRQVLGSFLNVVEVFLPQGTLIDAFRKLVAGPFHDMVSNINRTAHRNRQRQRVARPGINLPGADSVT